MWQWWLMTPKAWVAHPDRIVSVAEMETDHLEKVLAYLAGLTERRVWALRREYHDRVYRAYDHVVDRMGDMAQDAVSNEEERLHRATDRQFLQIMIPCLVALEQEAERRGLEVPAIPSYKCRRTLAAEEREAKAARLQEKARKRGAKMREAARKHAVRRRKHRCGRCGKPGHDRRKCPETK